MRDYQDVRNGLAFLTELLAKKGITMPHWVEEEELRDLVGELDNGELDELLEFCETWHAETHWGRSVCILQIEATRYHQGMRTDVSIYNAVKQMREERIGWLDIAARLEKDFHAVKNPEAWRTWFRRVGKMKQSGQ